MSALHTWARAVRSHFAGALAVAAVLLAPGAASAQLAPRFEHEGQLNYAYGVSTMRTGANGSSPCSVVSTGSSTSVTISGIPSGATIVGAYLYWAGSGSSDNSVTFAGSNTTGTMYTGSYSQGSTTFNFFGGRATVTSRVSGNGTYTLSNLAVTNTGSYCSSEAVVKGWSLLVVYRHASQPLRRITVFDGLHVIRTASGTLNLGGFLAAPAQDSRLSMLVWEGDATISGGESVSFNGTTLDGSGDVFNSSTGHGVDLETWNVSSMIDPGDRSASLTFTTQDDLMLLQTAVTSISITTVDVTPDGGTTLRGPGVFGETFAVENTSLASDNFNLRATRSGSPAFVQIDSITGPGIVGTTSGDSVRAAVPAQTTRNYTVWYTVPAGVTATNRITLTARSVTYPGVAQATATGYTDVQRAVAPDLEIAKTGAASLMQGSAAEYRISVRNVGSVATSAPITVTDVLPAGLAYISTDAVRGGWSFSVSGQTVTAVSAGALAVGDSVVFTLTADVGGAAVPSVTNTAVVSGGGQLNLANDTARASASVEGLSGFTISKMSTPQFTVGASNQSYTLRVRNNGTAAFLATVTVTDTLPEGITYLSRTGSSWTVSYDATTRVVTATYFSLLIGANSDLQDLVLNVAVSDAAYPSVTNTAWVSRNGTNSATITTQVNAPDIALQKTSPATFMGGAGSYTIVISNVGTVASSGAITVRDTLPAGITFASLSGTGWTLGTSGTTTGGRQFGDLVYAASLAPGATVSVTIAVTVAPSVVGVITNTAHVSGGSDANPANNSASAATQVGSPTLSIFTTVSPAGAVQPGQLLSYEVVFTNTGAAPAVDVVVHDDLPPDVQFRVGSVTEALPGGVTAQVEYFNGTTWSYAPQSGGCGAPAGFDGCVTAVRWVLQSPLPAGASGSGWIEARIR